MNFVKRGLVILFLFTTVTACSSTTETAKAEEPAKNDRMSHEEIEDCRKTGSRLAKRC